MFPSSDLARIRGPAPPPGLTVLMGPVGPAMSLGVFPLSDSESACVMDLSAGGTLSPSESDPTGPYVPGGPVGQIRTLSPSTSASAILVDPGGTLPSSNLVGMLFPAIPVGPVGLWGTSSPSDSDPAGHDGPYVTGGPVGHIGTLSPSASESGVLVDPGGMFPLSDLARMRGPAPPEGLAVLRGPVGPAMSLGMLSMSDSESAEPVMPTSYIHHPALSCLGHWALWKCYFRA